MAVSAGIDPVSDCRAGIGYNCSAGLLVNKTGSSASGNDLAAS